MARGSGQASEGSSPRFADSFDRFLSGQCAAFAVAAQQRFGGQIIGVGLDEDADDQTYDAWMTSPRYEHFGLELDDGRILDAEAVYDSLDQFMERHRYCEASVFSSTEALGLPYYDRQDLPAAERAVSKRWPQLT